LQPLFENAVRHGAARMTGTCEIRFKAYREAEWLRLIIRNDGPMPGLPSASSRFGVGLTNTKDRLRLQYENAFTFQYTQRTQGGVQIDISIPYHNTERNRSDKATPTSRLEHLGAAEIDLPSGEISSKQHTVH
jgi:two-component system, LytTR family, sensor kinase